MSPEPPSLTSGPPNAPPRGGGVRQGRHLLLVSSGASSMSACEETAFEIVSSGSEEVIGVFCWRNGAFIFAVWGFFGPKSAAGAALGALVTCGGSVRW